MKPENFYCSNKFTYLKIDFEKGMTYNCHAAAPHSVDFGWLENNPGNLFNTETNCREREQMLSGQRNASCEQNCYPAEDRGEVSTRMIESTPDRRFIEIRTQPRTVDVTLFSDCNLACSYCCKEYSTTWRRDLEQHGAYQLADFADPDRYSINAKDQLAAKFSQREKQNLSRVQALVHELKHMQAGLDTMIISGGEPLLNNHVMDVVHSAKDVPTIYLFTGLGVNFDRFQRLLDQLSRCSNVVLYISAENTGVLYEFNRSGLAWQEFDRRVRAVRDRGMRFDFRASVSNLTAPGLADFLSYADTDSVYMNFVHHPRFMSVGNLDAESKTQIACSLEPWQQHSQVQQVLDSLHSNQHTESDRVWLRDWITQFSQRRNQSLDCFAPNFRKWLQL